MLNLFLNNSSQTETLINFCCSVSSFSLMTPEPLTFRKSCQPQLRGNYLPPCHSFCSKPGWLPASFLVFNNTLRGVFYFQRLMMCPCLPEPPTKEIESEITESPASNTRRPADKDLGPMLPITKEILRDFYRPFNEKLAKLLHNDSFIWENDLKLQKPLSPFLFSAENHWYTSQWVSALSSAHENQ